LDKQINGQDSKKGGGKEIKIEKGKKKGQKKLFCMSSLMCHLLVIT
jgi:hypothetical protein